MASRKVMWNLAIKVGVSCRVGCTIRDSSMLQQANVSQLCLGARKSKEQMLNNVLKGEAQRTPRKLIRGHSQQIPEESTETGHNQIISSKTDQQLNTKDFGRFIQFSQ